MTWGELKAAIQSRLTAALEWIVDTLSVLGNWISETSAIVFEWVKEIALSVDAWVTKIVEMVQAGDTDNLPVDEILVAVFVTVISSYLLYSFVRSFIRLLQYRGGAEPEFQHQPTVVYHGRWKVYGQQPSFWAARRQRLWRKKLMTPEEQKKHIEKVQAQERKKRAKLERRSSRGKSSDRDRIREESKRRL